MGLLVIRPRVKVQILRPPVGVFFKFPTSVVIVETVYIHGIVPPRNYPHMVLPVEIGQHTIDGIEAASVDLFVPLEDKTGEEAGPDVGAQAVRTGGEQRGHEDFPGFLAGQ
jgi:hypothetical protein